jgi:RHS repeat-associated protein
VELPGGHVLATAYSEDGLTTTHDLRSRAGERITRREIEFTRGGSVAAIGNIERGLKSFAHGVHGLETVYRNGEVDERFVFDETGEWLPADGPGRVGPGGRLELFGAVSYEYDDEGRVSRRTEAGRSWNLEYNDRGQLVRSTGPDGDVTTFQYDALGRRIEKRNGNSETHWTWDGPNPFREEHRTNGQSEVRHWIFTPEDYVPLLVVKDDRCFSVITDHLGTPQEVLSEDGSVVWAGDYTAWGRLRRTRGEGFTNPLRFPGQWHDSETGLHYNRYRYYDPATGRYLTPDPIGMWGGLKPYAYASDPVDFADPTGLGCVRRFFSSFAVFLRSGIRPKHARAIMRQAMETGETYAFRNIGDRRGSFLRFTSRLGSMLSGLTGTRPKPPSVHAWTDDAGRTWGRSNWRGVARDGPGGTAYRSDYDPAYYRHSDGSMMNNAEANDANRAMNEAIGGDELQHPTQMTYPEVDPPGARGTDPPGNCTEFRPDGTTRQVPASETGPMWDDALAGSG